MIISIATQKGGSGKSTTAWALASGLHKRGYKTLLIDLDYQGNATYATGADTGGGNSYDLITHRAKATDIIRQVPQGDVIVSGKALSQLDLELTTTGKEYKLKEALKPIAKDYDYIILDTPPALNTITINALAASESVIIPAQADIFSIQGIAQLGETLDAVKGYCNPALNISGILLTRYNQRTILSQDLREIITAAASKMKTRVFKTVIREGVAIREAQASKSDLFTYAPRSNAAKDYSAFIDEFLKQRKP